MIRALFPAALFPAALFTAALVTAALQVGCSSPDTTTDTFPVDTNTPKTTPTFDMPVSYVRVVNLVTTEEGANLYIEGRKGAVLQGLEPFGGSNWREIEPGTRTFRVGPVGGEAKAEWASLAVDAAEDRRYSLVIHGAGADIRLLAFEEDPSSLPKDDVRISLFHAAPDQGPMDLYEVPEKKTGTQVPLVTDLTFGKGPEFLQRMAQRFALGVDIDDDGAVDATFEVPDLGGRVTMPLYFVVEGDDLVLAGQAPQGKVRLQRVDLGLGDADTAGDTGS